MMMMIRRKTRHVERIRGFVFSVLGTITFLKGQNLCKYQRRVDNFGFIVKVKMACFD